MHIFAKSILNLLVLDPKIKFLDYYNYSRGDSGIGNKRHGSKKEFKGEPKPKVYFVLETGIIFLQRLWLLTGLIQLIE